MGRANGGPFIAALRHCRLACCCYFTRIRISIRIRIRIGIGIGIRVRVHLAIARFAGRKHAAALQIREDILQIHIRSVVEQNAQRNGQQIRKRRAIIEEAKCVAAAVPILVMVLIDTVAADQLHCGYFIKAIVDVLHHKVEVPRAHRLGAGHRDGIVRNHNGIRSHFAALVADITVH